MQDKPKMGSMFGGETGGGLFDIPLVPAGTIDDAAMVVMGVPVATPYQSVGAYCQDAADAIRAAFGWPGLLQHYDFDLGGPLLGDGVNAVDWGNLACDLQDFSYNRKLISDHVGDVLDNGAVPLVLGGDDSVPIPVLQAYEQHGPITVLQLDDHIDWRDEVQGERMGLSSNMRRASEMPWVSNIVQAGARGSGSARPEDFNDAVNWGVNFFPMKSIRAENMQKGIDAIIDAIAVGSDIYIALDIDVMDPSVVPGVIGPAPGGFGYYDVLSILEKLSTKARIVGFNLVEFMPSADIGNRGALVSARIAASVMGLVARQRS